MAETSRNPESKMSAMESVTEDPSQPLSPLKKGKIDTTQALQHIRSRATNFREKLRRLQWRGLSEAGEESLQLKEQKDFLTTYKLELDKKRLLVISEQKEHTSGSVLRVERPDLWSENRLVALKRELLREETLLSKLEEKGLTSLEGRSKSDDNSSRYEILNALTELMQVGLLEHWPDFTLLPWICDFPDCQSHVCYEILVYSETFLFLLESQVDKGKQAITSTDQHSRVDSLRQVVDAQQKLLNMQKMTYQKMTGTKQEKETPGQGESEEGKKKLLQRMSVTKQEEGTLGQAETVEGIKQSAHTSKKLELILEQTRVLTEIEREGLYRTSTKEELVSIIFATFETTFDAMLLLTNSSTLMLERRTAIFDKLVSHIEHMPMAIPDSFHFPRWMVYVNSTLMDALHLMVREIRTTGELLQKFSVKEPLSQDQVTEIRSRATNLRKKCRRLRRRGLSEAGQESLQLKEQKDFLTTHKLELDKERLLVISEQKGYTSGSVLRVKRQALWSENRLVALKRELLREETLLSKLEENRLTSLQGRSKSDDNSSRSEILNALTELMKVQEDRPHFPFGHRIRDFSDCQSLVCYEILVYAETFLFLLESQVRKGKQAITSTDQHSRVDSLRQVVDAQQELLNMQKMTYQKMTGTKQEKKTPGQGESEEGKKKLLQRMSVIKQEEGTLGQAETVEGIKQSADTSKKLELILEQTRVADEIEREGLDRTSTDQELFSVISATFETTFDAMLLLTHSSTLPLEHLMETFEALLCPFEHMPVAIPDSRHISWLVVNVNSTLMDALHPRVREIRTTGELLQKFSVKEPLSQDQVTETSVSRRTPSDDSGKSEAAPVEHVPRVQEETSVSRRTPSDDLGKSEAGPVEHVPRLQEETLRKDVTLSEDTKRKLCEELNNKSADKDWESLLSYLCDVGPVFLKDARERLKDPAGAVLNAYFSIRSKGEAANTIKLMHLKEVFNRLDMSNALQILNEDDAVRELPGCLPSHLQKVLEEFYLLTADISENNLLGKVFQLPNIAIGYFDSVGGSLLLEDYGVHLYVPGGALPSGRVQQVYIYVDPNASPMDDVKPPKIVLSRMIQCGPPQLAFKRNVVLSFPYQATEDVKWTLITQVCQNDNEALRSWEDLEGDKVFLTKDEVIVLLDHFTGVRQTGMPNENVRCVGVYGPEIDERSRTFEFRVRVWKNEEEARKRVNDREILKRSKLLDTERMLLFDPNKGDVVVDVTNISKPWQIEQSTEKVITKDKVASLPENSVTFILERTVNLAPTSVFHFNVQVEQTGNESRTTFVHRCAREGAGTPQDGVSCTCGTVHVFEMCPVLQEAMKESLANMLIGNKILNSLPQTAMQDLCQLLDNGTDNTSNSQGLARYLVSQFELNNNSTDVSAEDLLAIFFGRCHKRQDSLQRTVDLLIAALRSIENTEAVLIAEDFIRTEPMEL